MKALFEKWIGVALDLFSGPGGNYSMFMLQSLIAEYRANMFALPSDRKLDESWPEVSNLFNELASEISLFTVNEQERAEVLDALSIELFRLAGGRFPKTLSLAWANSTVA